MLLANLTKKYFFIFSVAAFFLIMPGCMIANKTSNFFYNKIKKDGVSSTVILNLSGRHGILLKKNIIRELEPNKRIIIVDIAQNKKKADFIVCGSVQVRIKDKPCTGRMRVEKSTGQYKKTRNASGVWQDREIKRIEIIQVQNINRSASFTFDFYIYDIEKDKIIAGQKIIEKYNKKFGNNSRSGVKNTSLPQRTLTINSMAENVAVKFAKILKEIIY